jgi:hypothetical protein
VECLERQTTNAEKTTFGISGKVGCLMNKCRYCGKSPTVADVGGVNPYYELCCPCGKSPVIGSYNKEEVINTWNILNKRSDE